MFPAPHHSRPIPDALRSPVASRAEGEAWIFALIRDGRLYHFDDSPETIINGPSGERIFSDADADIVRQRMCELHALDWGEHECPIGYAMHIEAEVELTVEFETWCRENGLEPKAAEEILADSAAGELSHVKFWTGSTTLTDDKWQWLIDFIGRWDAMIAAREAGDDD